jgi:hypothetical protein
MEQTSTHDLLVLHAYGETTLEQREYLAKQLATNETLQDELMEIIATKRQLTSKLKSPSATSLRIIMDYSHKSEHLHEI